MDTAALLASTKLTAADPAEILAVAAGWARTGRESEAQALYDHVAAVRPKKQMRAYWPLALTSGKTGEEWATPALKRADLHINHLQFDEARAILAAVTAPALAAQVLTGQARLALAAGGGAAALALTDQAQKLAPASSYTKIIRAAALLANDRAQDTIALLTSAAKDGRTGAWFLLGLAYQRLQRPVEAADAYRKGYAFDPEDFGPANNLLPALLEARQYRDVLEHADTLLAARPGHSTSLAYKHIALGELGRTDELAALSDMALLVREELPLPPGYANRAAFHQALAAEIAREPTLAYQRNTTRFGYQTDDVGYARTPALQALNAALSGVVRRRAAAARANPAHPFHSAAPRDFRLYSWGVILREKGYQAPHFHPHGWLSGVYYIAVPGDITETDPARAGWIEFGRGDERWNQPSTAMPTTQLRPTEGALFTFPSYFWHSTRPLRTDQARISYAFDVIPLDGP
ncbi:MAG: hypothetical protein K1X51_00240 [Rhodospirillaceae bacterium]|nr:hypothetical protein [Rhodospirillaceae bacterium]